MHPSTMIPMDPCAAIEENRLLLAFYCAPPCAMIRNLTAVSSFEVVNAMSADRKCSRLHMW